MSDDNQEVPVAIAALIISIVALIAASLQIWQAIFARNLPKCDENVIGDWAKGPDLGHKIKLLRGLQLEVHFEAPVIFLAPHDVKRGPVDGDVWYAGEEDSCKKSRVSLEDPKSDKKDGTSSPVGPAKSDAALATLGNGKAQPAKTGDNEPPAKPKKEPIHTVENEKATWLSLLVAIERMERDSHMWESAQRKAAFGTQALPIYSQPSLTVKMQAMRRKFDTNPPIKKPYATTTISHIVELAAVLGLYWKLFNRDENKYRAEGNGFILMGSRVSGFGIVFNFEKTRKFVFGKRRVIPTKEVKELCFGRVPTLFRIKEEEDDMFWLDPVNMASDNHLKVEVLQLGSRDEIAETLTQIGCNASTTLFYKEKKKHQHLFPVTFEIMGMLARNLHVRNRCFRFLPNPSIFQWDRESLSMSSLLWAFSVAIGRNCESIDEQGPNNIAEDSQPHVAMIKQLSEDAQALLDAVGDKGDLTFIQLNAIHDAIDRADKTLKCESPSEDQNIVLDVIRRHLQEVLAAINKTGPTEVKEELSFDDLLETPREMREIKFMDIYFERILWSVIPSTGQGDQERVSQHIHEETRHRLQSRKFEGNAPPPDIQVSPTSLAAPSDQLANYASDGAPVKPVLNKAKSLKPGLPATKKELPTWKSILETPIETQRLKIWYTLVFRMICWLMLHDFEKKDVQLPDSDLMGNRQPVYIT